GRVRGTGGGLGGEETKGGMALVNAAREIVRKIMTGPRPRWEPQFPAEGRKCGQLFSGRARGRRAVGYFLRSAFDLPTESPSVFGPLKAIPFTASDVRDPKRTRQFASLADMAEEQKNVRVWGGVHYRFA